MPDMKTHRLPVYTKIFTGSCNAYLGLVIVYFRVERIVTSPLPHRPVRADFPHTVPLKLDSLKYRMIDLGFKKWHPLGN